MSGNQRTGDQNSSDDDDDDDDDRSYDNESEESDEARFDKKFMNGRNGGTTETTTTRNSGSNNNGSQKSNSRRYDQNSGSSPYPYNRMMNNTSSRVDTANDRILRNNNTNLRNGGSNSGGNFGQEMQGNRQDQACVIQCFFEELNLVDDKGYPEKSAVTKMMTRNIRDPELKDFVEEALIGCYYMMEAENIKDECRISQYLLNCLAGKGRERCEDWD